MRGRQPPKYPVGRVISHKGKPRKWRKSRRHVFHSAGQRLGQRLVDVLQKDL